MSTKVAADLRAIIDMAARLEARAIDCADDEIPGGEATVNLAPVARPGDWARRNELAGDALAGYEDPDEFWSSYQTLRFWSEQWRIDLDMDHDDPRWQPTLVSEAEFLRNPDVLGWALDNEVHFDDFAADVGRARTKLENVLREGERAERLRVTCPDCAQPHVDGGESDEQAGDGESPQCDSERPAERRTAPRLIAVYGDNEHGDRWKCPTCKHKFDADQVRRAQTAQMRRAGIAQRWITFADALAILRRQGWREATVRGWAHDATEVSATVRNGVAHYWWPDLWRRHLLHRWEVNEDRKRAEDLERRKAECAKHHGPDCWIHRRGCGRVLAKATVVCLP